MDNNNIPLSRSVRLDLPSYLAKVLIKNVSDVNALNAQLRLLAAKDQELVSSFVADHGHKLENYERWEYENGKDGTTTLILVPAPLPMPEPPRPPEPPTTPAIEMPAAAEASMTAGG